MRRILGMLAVVALVALAAMKIEAQPELLGPAPGCEGSDSAGR